MVPSIPRPLAPSLWQERPLPTSSTGVEFNLALPPRCLSRRPSPASTHFLTRRATTSLALSIMCNWASAPTSFSPISALAVRSPSTATAPPTTCTSSLSAALPRRPSIFRLISRIRPPFCSSRPTALARPLASQSNSRTILRFLRLRPRSPQAASALHVQQLLHACHILRHVHAHCVMRYFSHPHLPTILEPTQLLQLLDPLELPLWQRGIFKQCLAPEGI